MCRQLPDFDSLAPLESCDPSVFVSGDRAEQEVLDFILSLALVFNDIKNIYWATIHMDAFAPQSVEEISPSAGQFAGMKNHLIRLLCSTLSEFIRLVRDNETSRSSALFTAVIGRCPAAQRRYWNDIVEVSKGGVSDESNDVRELLVKIRNNAGYHYFQVSALGEGYRHFISRDQRSRRRAYVSRGGSMKESRYYFADAAAQGIWEMWEGERMSDAIGKMVEATNGFLIYLMTAFAAIRGFAWRSETQ